MPFGQVVVDAGCVVPVPSNWSTYEAAGFMETTLTAYLNIFQIGGAARGKSVLIHGGGSGIGTCELRLIPCIHSASALSLLMLCGASLRALGSPMRLGMLSTQVMSVAIHSP